MAAWPKWVTVSARAVVWLAAWFWALLAGGGGLYLLFTLGPLPLTNGWFALFSGLSACPLTATVWQKHFHRKLPGWVRFAAALFFFLAGRAALLIGCRIPWLARCGPLDL